MGTETLSSPRLAFDRVASYMRVRMIPSSNSEMLPFMPSSSRSFGRHGSSTPSRSMGLDQPAQLEQMMPVTAVAGETRGIETQHGTDLPAAQGGD